MRFPMAIRRNEVLFDLSIIPPSDKLGAIIITDIYMYLILSLLFKSCFIQYILSYSFSSFNSFQLLPTTYSISYFFSLSNTHSHWHTHKHTHTCTCAHPCKHTKFPQKAQAYFVLNNYSWTWDNPGVFDISSVSIGKSKFSLPWELSMTNSLLEGR